MHRDRDDCDITIESYDAGIGGYLANTARLPESLRPFLDRFAAALVTGGHVLELGSGPGWDANYLESRGLRVERSDATPAFVERLRARGHEARSWMLATSIMAGHTAGYSLTRCCCT